MLKTTEAVVLAGGLGTRLKHLLPDLPKSMAPVNNRPFLEYLFDSLIKQGIKKVILSVGYKHEVIIEHFKDKYKSLHIIYAVENEPLGTGGAIAYSFTFAAGDQVFVLNGDTLFPAVLKELEDIHFSKNASLTIVLRYLSDLSRFGSVITDKENRITAFAEKRQNAGSGYINGGIYLINKNLFSRNDISGKFSFEKDVMEKYLSTEKFYAIPSDAYFIDIGVPEDYARAQEEFAKLI